MTEPVFTSIEECFSELLDPRAPGRCDHKLIDLIIITVCAVICGADSRTGVETFGKAKLYWMKRYLDLPNGIPSYATFGRVCASLNAEAFQAGFGRWMEAAFRVTKGKVVAIDGRTVRRSHDQTIGQDGIYMVSALASQNGIAQGQRQVDNKSNGITAIPELLRLLDVSGCIVTIDAMGCQKDIAHAIRDTKADYVLRVKDNQGHLYQEPGRVVCLCRPSSISGHAARSSPDGQ